MIEGLQAIDYRIFETINQVLVNNFLDWLMPILRNKMTWIPLYLLLAFLLFKTFGLKSLFIITGALFCVVLTDQISSALLKPWINRSRPCQNPDFAENIRLLIDCGVGKSFTSSHAANHFGLFAYFSFIFGKNRSRLVFLGFIWAALISYAQVYVGVHFPIDVIGGGILGLVAGTSTAFLFLKINEQYKILTIQ